MRKGFFGLVAGILLVLGFSAPASAATDPITFTFTDGCGFIDTKVTNNTAEPVQYKLATIFSGFPTAMGALDFTLAGGATTTHRWLVRFHHGVRASSPSITGDIDHLYDTGAGGCNALWPQPLMQQDCKGEVLAAVAAIDQAGLGDPVFAVNGKPGKPFSPSATHLELIEGLHPGDVVSFRVPALTEPHELVTWYQIEIQESRHCANMPPVTVTFTCTGIDVKTVNTGDEERELQVVVALGARTFTLGAGQALDENLPATPGVSVAIFWALPDFETGFNPAAVLGIFARPQSCDASPAPPGDGGSLPRTGAPTLLMASAGGLLLLLGAGLFVFTRRRRRVPIA